MNIPRFRIGEIWNELKLVFRVSKRVIVEQWEVSKSLLIINAIFVPITALTPIAASYLAGVAINKLVDALDGSIPQSEVYLAFILAAFVGLISSLLYPVQRFFVEKSEIKLTLFLERRMNEFVVNIDVPTRETPRFVELFNKVLYRHVMSHQILSEEIFRSAGSIFQIVGVSIILINYSIWLLPALLIAVVPSIFSSSYISKLRDKIVWNDPDNLRRLERQTAQYMYMHDTNIEIRLNTAKSYFLDKANHLRKTFADRESRVNAIRFRLDSATNTFEDIVILIIQISFIGRVLTDRSFGIGTYTFYFQTVQRFSTSSTSLFLSLGRIYEHALVMRDFYEIADMKPVLIESPNAKNIELSGPPKIELKNVSFSYPGSDKKIIDDLSMTIEPGENIALVGENGSGKSTLVKLITRLYEVDSGEILINGLNINEIKAESWHSNVSVLLQDYGNYIYDVHQNIGVGRIENMNDVQKIESAIKKADADDFISKYKHGIKQKLSPEFEDGLHPSGGQWQRMGIARALFRDAYLLILDEPTAAVDAKSEYKIFKQILEHQKQNSTIIISHRFSTVRQADKIYVLENGTVSASGSHDELMKSDNTYKKMFELQAEGYR